MSPIRPPDCNVMRESGRLGVSTGPSLKVRFYLASRGVRGVGKGSLVKPSAPRPYNAEVRFLRGGAQRKRTRLENENLNQGPCSQWHYSCTLWLEPNSQHAAAALFGCYLGEPIPRQPGGGVLDGKHG